jgi:uncharacterized membrane protein
MTIFLVALSTWLHDLATIVMIGYYLFTSLIFLPVFERQIQANALRDLLEQVTARLRPYFGGSLLIFLVSGTYLMMSNQAYQGLGNFLGNPWSILIVVKHVLVLAFLALAIYSERAFLGQISDENPEALKKFRLSSKITLIMGLFILLLTSIAQAIDV